MKTEEQKIQEQLESIKALDRKKEIIESQITRVLEMKRITDEGTATRIAIDNSSIVHNSFFIDNETAQQIFTVLYTSLTTQREQLIIQAEKLIGPIDQAELEPKENETAPAI